MAYGVFFCASSFLFGCFLALRGGKALSWGDPGPQSPQALGDVTKAHVVLVKGPPCRAVRRVCKCPLSK